MTLLFSVGAETHSGIVLVPKKSEESKQSKGVMSFRASLPRIYRIPLPDS